MREELINSVDFTLIDARDEELLSFTRDLKASYLAGGACVLAV